MFLLLPSAGGAWIQISIYKEKKHENSSYGVIKSISMRLNPSLTGYNRMEKRKHSELSNSSYRD